jgi:hypothetical protein
MRCIIIIPQTIDTVSYECSDTGSFYTCGQQATAWANRGNVLRNSVFKKVRNTTPFHLGAPSVQAICKPGRLIAYHLISYYSSCIRPTLAVAWPELS